MKGNSLLIKVFSLSFYRHYALEMLILTGLTFGFMSGLEHIALANFFVSSPSAALFPCTAWLIYSLVVVSFNARCFRKEQYFFLHTTTYRNTSTLLIRAVWFVSIQMMPVYAYAIFLLLIMVKQTHFAAAPLVIVFPIILTSFILISWFLKYKAAPVSILTSNLITWVNRYHKNTFTRIAIGWIVRIQSTHLLLIKSVACMLLLGCANLYRFDTYDHRLMAMITVAVASLNGTWLSRLHRFEHQHFYTHKSLPIGMYDRVRSILLVLLLVDIPELTTLMLVLPDWSFNYFSCIILFVGLQLFLYGLYTSYVFENVAGLLLIIMLCGLSLIILSTPVALVATTCTVVGLFLWTRNYYNLEYPAA